MTGITGSVFVLREMAECNQKELTRSVFKMIFGLRAIRVAGIEEDKKKNPVRFFSALSRDLRRIDEENCPCYNFLCRRWESNPHTQGTRF